MTMLDSGVWTHYATTKSALRGGGTMKNYRCHGGSVMLEQYFLSITFPWIVQSISLSHNGNKHSKSFSSKLDITLNQHAFFQ